MFIYFPRFFPISQPIFVGILYIFFILIITLVIVKINMWNDFPESYR